MESPNPSTEAINPEPSNQPQGLNHQSSGMDNDAAPAADAAFTVKDETTKGDQNHDQAQQRPHNISDDEVALYDRQIRLWGFQAQQLIREANILLVNVKALGNEVAKNLVLAGIESLTIADTAHVMEEDLGANFSLTPEDIGKPRSEAAATSLQKLNPRVTITAHPPTFDPTTTDPSFFTRFTLIIATDLPISQLNLLNTAARFSSVPFYAGGAHGLYGFVFADLIAHEFSISRDAPNVPTKVNVPETKTRTVIGSTTSYDSSTGKKLELVTKREIYQPLILANSSPLPSHILSSPRRLHKVTPLLPCLRALWDFEATTGGYGPSHSSNAELGNFTATATAKSRELQLPNDALKAEFLRGFLQSLYSECAPTTAFLGGALAQDVINVIGRKEQPVQNMMFFDGEESRADVLSLLPEVGMDS
ncbi:MAG: hypothetical protein M1831_006062 [Alyxoria varia]|nr:MAG: hypothetical protein M1831_006062 [Alyxoria varia]